MRYTVSLITSTFIFYLICQKEQNQISDHASDTFYLTVGVKVNINALRRGYIKGYLLDQHLFAAVWAAEGEPWDNWQLGGPALSTDCTHAGTCTEHGGSYPC